MKMWPCHVPYICRFSRGSHLDQDLGWFLAIVLLVSSKKIQTNSILTLQCDMVPIMHENFSFILIHAVIKPIQERFKVAVMVHGSVHG